jgi:hypothetical protein
MSKILEVDEVTSALTTLRSFVLSLGLPTKLTQRENNSLSILENEIKNLRKSWKYEHDQVTSLTLQLAATTLPPVETYTTSTTKCQHSWQLMFEDTSGKHYRCYYCGIARDTPIGYSL